MRDPKPSRGTLFLLIFAGICLLAAVGLRTVRPITQNVDDVALRTLQSQHAELRQFDSLALSKAQEERAAAEARLWTPEKIAAWRATLPGNWRAQELPPISSAVTTQRRYLVTLASPAFRDWPMIVSVVTDLAARPGIRLSSLSVTAPVGSKRVFSQVQILVSFFTAKAPDQTSPKPPAA